MRKEGSVHTCLHVYVWKLFHHGLAQGARWRETGLVGAGPPGLSRAQGTGFCSSRTSQATLSTFQQQVSIPRHASLRAPLSRSPNPPSPHPQSSESPTRLLPSLSLPLAWENGGGAFNSRCLGSGVPGAAGKRGAQVTAHPSRFLEALELRARDQDSPHQQDRGQEHEHPQKFGQHRGRDRREQPGGVRCSRSGSPERRGRFYGLPTFTPPLAPPRARPLSASPSWAANPRAVPPQPRSCGEPLLRRRGKEVEGGSAGSGCGGGRREAGNSSSPGKKGGWWGASASSSTLGAAVCPSPVETMSPVVHLLHVSPTSLWLG